MGAVILVVTGWAFSAGHTTAGYVLGGLLAGLASLVAVTNICIPSMIFRAVFGPPKERKSPVAKVGTIS
jgi:hypothetical protein